MPKEIMIPNPDRPMDSRFRVEVIGAMPFPQTMVVAALRQDYSEEFIFDEFPNEDETKCGEIAIKHLLNGHRGHFGPLEHPQIVLNVGHFPHGCMQQVRTHRVGVSFDVQSFRYTGARIVAVAEGKRDVEEVFYIRPVGSYTDRQGDKYDYTQEQREEDLAHCLASAQLYQKRFEQGVSGEQARSIIAYDVRQSWIMSANCRSLMHLLDLRSKGNAQMEAVQMCELIWPHFEKWMPEIAAWYKENRWGKARLSP